MSELRLSLTDAPSEDAKQVINEGLADYNADVAGYRDWLPLAALVHDAETNHPLGGMLGRSSYGLLFIDTVFLPPTLRGQDLGTRLLLMMEAEGVRRGCQSAVLFTITFQAPGFYARHGWTEFGRVACDPPGTARVFMTKKLMPANQPDEVAT